MISDTTPAGDRERLRYLIARAWRRNGRNAWTDAELSEAVDAALVRRQTSAPAAAPVSVDSRSTAGPLEPQPNQPCLFGANATERETRAIAAASSFASGPRRCDRIAAHVATCGNYGATREDIAEALDLPIQTVCPLVKSMRANGRLVSTSRTRLTRSGKPAAVLVTPGNVTGTGDRNR